MVEASSTAAEGMLYIQCFECDKPSLTEWVSNFITTYSNVYPEDEQPFLVATKPDGTDSLTMTHQTNTSWNRLQHILDDPSLTSTITDGKIKPTIPVTTHTQLFTYAKVAQHSYTEFQVNQMSAISSPTNSQVTITSKRAQEIEENVDLLACAFAAMLAQQ